MSVCPFLCSHPCLPVPKSVLPDPFLLAKCAEVVDADADEAFTLPLVHNIEVLIEGAENDIYRLQRSLSTEQDGLVTLKHEQHEAQRKLDEQDYHINRCAFCSACDTEA